MYRIKNNFELPNERVNSTLVCGGRFGNIFIRTLVAEYFAMKNNYLMKYERIEQFKRLGIELFSGT